VVDDLISHVPAELHEPLERGRAGADDAARRMQIAEFLGRVARHAGVPPELAHLYVRAVLAALREAVGDELFSDLSAQLPDEYAELLPAG
jgi:uncharacterized protein (DUF2267 family)